MASNVGQTLPFAAHHTGSLWVHGDLETTPGGVTSLGVGGVASSERALLDHTMVPGYLRVDALASERIERYFLSLRVENVANVRYVRGGNDVNGILPGAPRIAPRGHRRLAPLSEAEPDLLGGDRLVRLGLVDAGDRVVRVEVAPEDLAVAGRAVGRVRTNLRTPRIPLPSW